MPLLKDIPEGGCGARAAVGAVLARLRGKGCGRGLVCGWCREDCRAAGCGAGGPLVAAAAVVQCSVLVVLAAAKGCAAQRAS